MIPQEAGVLEYRKVHFYIERVRWEKTHPKLINLGQGPPHLSCLLHLTQWGPPTGRDLAPNNVYLQIPSTHRVQCGKQYLTVLWKKTAKLTGFFPWFLGLIDELLFPSPWYFLCLQPCRLLKQQWENFIMFYTFIFSGDLSLSPWVPTAC